MNSLLYKEFLSSKQTLNNNYGFSPIILPDILFDFQKALVEWALLKGRGAIFADCGLGKTPMQLLWAENIVRKTNKNVLIVSPLAVSTQTIREGEKFQVECKRSINGEVRGKITITNYERLHYFDETKFIAVVLDESSAIKHFTGERQKAVTQFMKKIPYRLLCTATPSPNDYIELGTSSEALGYLGHMDMLSEFFKLDEDNSLHRRGRLIWEGAKYIFKAHAKQEFWRWICSWARALRKPSDLGFDDANFILPKLNTNEIIVKASRPYLKGTLFTLPATNLHEQRAERKATITERCEAAYSEIKNKPCAILWCHYNAEADYLEKIIPNSQQVKGGDSDDKKEETFMNFTDGKLQFLITKPKIGGFGLNWQHCSDMTFFPSHSFEQYYQAVRRCWRFGQQNPVNVNIITTEGESKVLNNLKRKDMAVQEMFINLIMEMNKELKKHISIEYNTKMEIPKWL